MQVDVGEAPLFLRRYKIRVNYWVNLKGHKESHSVNGVIEECWEHGNKNIKSFGWIDKREAQVAGFADCEVIPTVYMCVCVCVCVWVGVCVCVCVYFFIILF